MLRGGDHWRERCHDGRHHDPPRGHRGYRHPHDAGPHERRPPRGHRRDPQRQEDLLHATVRRPDGRADGQRQVQMRGRFVEQWGHVGDLIQLRVKR